MAQQGFVNIFMDIPPVTKIVASSYILTSFLIKLQIISPFDIYFNSQLIFRKFQIWRLFTNFLFLGNVSLGLFLNILFFGQYSRSLEENTFYNRSADYVWMFLFGMMVMNVINFVFGGAFMSHELTLMIIYVWSQKNHQVRFSLFGIFTFSAAYLPYVLWAVSFVFGNSDSTDIIGILVGHLYVFVQDIYPTIYGGPSNLLRAPYFLRKLLDESEESRNPTPPVGAEPIERVGGQNWGEN